jgi:hypothetical protein
VRYDLETGQPTPVYTVEEEGWQISGFAPSHDQRSIALTLENRPTLEGLLVILDYEGGTGRASVAAKMLAPYPREGRPIPCAWSPDDQTIFFQGVAYREGWTYLWASSRDGSGLHPLPALAKGILSPDGRWYAYTDGQLPPWPGPQIPCSVIGLLDLTTGTTSTVVQQENPDRWFLLRASWSPDSRQLLYSSRDSSTLSASLAEESEGEVSYLYDLSTGSSRPILSWREQQRTWFELTPACARRFGTGTIESVETLYSCIGDLIVQGRVVDSGHLIYIGRLPALE